MDKILEVATFAAESAMMATAAFNIVINLFVASTTISMQFSFALLAAFFAGWYRLKIYRRTGK